MKSNQVFLVFLISTLSISCGSNTNIIINDYYFDSNSSNVYYFDSLNNSSLIFDLNDSLMSQKKIKIIGSKIIFDENKKFNYKMKDRKLIIKNYNENSDLELTMFKRHNINLDDLKELYWSMILKKYDREKEINYEEEQIISLDNKLKMKGYYIYEKDTIYAKDYKYLGNYFNKFQTFGSSYSKIIFLSRENEKLDIIINNEEFKTRKYELKLVKVKNISDEMPKLNGN